MNNTYSLPKAHVVFVLDTQPQKSILLVKREGKEGYSLPHSKIEDQDSHSGVFTVARALVEKFKGIDPRELTSYDESHNIIVDWDALKKAQEDWTTDPPVSQAFENLRNPLFIIWQKIFTETPLWNSDDQSELLYFLNIDEKDLETFKTKNPQISFIVCQEKPEQVSKGFEKLLEKIDLFQILNSKSYLDVEDTFLFFGFKLPTFDRWIPPRAFLHTYAIFDGLYRRRKERWIQLNIPDNEFPTPEQLKEAKGIIMCGSSCSSYDNHQWIRDLEEFLRKSYQDYPHLRFLGICFGLQVLSQAFGGKVEPCPQRRENRMFYLSGNENLIMDTERLKEVPQFKSIPIQREHLINKAHGDEITVVPEFFINVGTSASCKNEVLISNDHRIFGYQGHPEYSNEGQKKMLVCLLTYFQKKKQQDFVKDESFFQKWAKGTNDKIHRDLCMAFLKN